MKKIIKNFKRFKKDCPTLTFGGSYLAQATLRVTSPYTDEEIAEGIKVMRRNLFLLKADAVLIPELEYLANVMQRFYDAVNESRSDEYFFLNIGKLRYCKTLLAYTDAEYTEDMLAILDDLQDQLADEHGLDKNEVFYSVEEEEEN